MVLLATGKTAQAVGGPFDKDGSIGKQFKKDGAVGKRPFLGQDMLPCSRDGYLFAIGRPHA